MERSEVEFVRVNRETGCWEWARAITRSTGYGTLRIRGKNHSAHRWVYENLVGPVPRELTLDHLCRNRACVRPAHLEVVTMKENIRRGSSPNIVASRTGVCRNGHRSWQRARNGRNFCRPCRDEYMREYRRRAVSA